MSVGATKIGTLAHTNLEQKVEITAQFPNAIYHDEIKEAFDTLINGVPFCCGHALEISEDETSGKCSICGEEYEFEE